MPDVTYPSGEREADDMEVGSQANGEEKSFGTGTAGTLASRALR